MVRTKIGFTGPMSESNFGDYAMFINNVYEIDVDEIVTFTYNKGFSQKIINDYLKDYSITNIEVKLKEAKEGSLEDTTKNSQKVGFLPFNHPTDTPIDILLQLENYEEIRKSVEEIDVLIVNGGGYFNHLWNNSLWRNAMLKKIIAPILIASQLRKPIYFTGNGYGPFDQSEEFFNYTFNYIKNATFGVRDKMYSRGYLNRIGIENEKIRFIPDDLLLIKEEIKNLPTHEMEVKSKKEKYIVLELYYSLEEIKDYTEELKEFSNIIHDKYGYSIVFLPFDLNRGGMIQGEYLESKLENFYLYDINKYGYLSIEDAVEVIRNAELVICTRYHAMVLSVGLGVPVVNMIKKVCDDHRYYFNKNYGLLDYVFDGIVFNEMDYIKSDVKSTLKYLKSNIINLIEVQNKVYNNERYKGNLSKLKQVREIYLHEIIN